MRKTQDSNRRSPDVDREIDENLKRAFRQVEEEPIPDRFTDLLDQLRRSGGKPSSGDGSADD